MKGILLMLLLLPGLSAAHNEPLGSELALQYQQFEKRFLRLMMEALDAHKQVRYHFGALRSPSATQMCMSGMSGRINRLERLSSDMEAVWPPGRDLGDGQWAVLGLQQSAAQLRMCTACLDTAPADCFYLLMEWDAHKHSVDLAGVAAVSP